MKRFLKDCLGAALLAGVLCYATTSAHAAQPVKLTDAQVLRGWYNFNDHCTGDQIEPDVNPACNAREAATRMLEARGWSWANNDVWISPQDTRNVLTVVEIVQLKSDERLAPEALLGTVADYLGRNDTPSDAFIAVWNKYSATYRDQYPYGWAVVSETARAVSQMHPNDPRYSLNQ